jgi:hypothetical protein
LPRRTGSLPAATHAETVVHSGTTFAWIATIPSCSGDSVENGVRFVAVRLRAEGSHVRLFAARLQNDGQLMFHLRNGLDDDSGWEHGR